MAVDVWVLGDTEAEVAAELRRLGLRPLGRMMQGPGRHRLLQRADRSAPAEAEPAPERD